MNRLHPLEHWDRVFESLSRHVRLFCVCVVLCVGSGLATGWSSFQGVLPTVYRIKKLKKRPRSKRLYSHRKREEKKFGIFHVHLIPFSSILSKCLKKGGISIPFYQVVNTPFSLPPLIAGRNVVPSLIPVPYWKRKASFCYFRIYFSFCTYAVTKKVDSGSFETSYI
jgi:hypothetical protein